MDQAIDTFIGPWPKSLFVFTVVDDISTPTKKIVKVNAKWKDMCKMYESLRLMAKENFSLKEERNYPNSDTIINAFQ